MRAILSMISTLVILSVYESEMGWAQVTQERLTGTKAMLESVKASYQLLPEQARQMLSSGVLNLINLAERFEQIEPGQGQAHSELDRPTEVLPQINGDEETPEALSQEPKQVSDPSTDVAFSSFGGFTQNETSTAWCGDNVVVGFNDSGSFFETQFLPRAPIGISFNGYARSTDKGASFTDLGFLNPGPVGNFLSGDPVLRCTDPSTFYYASILVRPGRSDISVSKSTDGGATFDDPVSAASKDTSTHLLDKPWMDVDPTNPNRIYVTYTDFDFSFTSEACPFDFRTAIELVRSDDGGQTWSAPVVIREVCGINFVQGSQIAVGPGGEVYVAWEEFSDFLVREIDIRKSTDNGVTFGDIVKVDDVTPVGDGFLLQGAFRSLFEVPSLTVDRSGGPTNGNVYIAWHDSRNLSVQDAISGRYGFADILVSSSTDGGDTWSSPVQVNDNTEPLVSGLGTDQYQPAIATDNTGDIEICFYDRREDPRNFLIDRFCALSTDAGASWTNTRITTRRFAAVPGQDFLNVSNYMGDYDSLASDFTGSNNGFIGAWGDNSRGNPDVKANSDVNSLVLSEGN